MKKFFFSLLSVVFAMTVQAQLTAGDYVIQNVGTGYYLGGGVMTGVHMLPCFAIPKSLH